MELERVDKGDTLQKLNEEGKMCESSGLGLGAGGVTSLDRSFVCNVTLIRGKQGLNH
jgi:hypothetical protein